MTGLPEIMVENITIQSGSRTVYLGSQLIEMTGLEFNLLWLLMKSAPQVVSRESIAKLIFNRSLIEANRSINMHVSTIRKKLLTHAKYSPIKTIKGQGYLFLTF
jgi:two-component system response regulator CpxR